MPRIPALGAFLLLASLVLGGCKKPAETGDGPAPAGSEAPSSECAAYTKALCEKVGADSPHCGAIRDLEPLLPPKACAAATKDIAYTALKFAEEMKPCTDLADRLCKELGEEAETCKMVRARTPNFPPPECRRMTENYASVLADLRKAQEKLKPLDPAKVAELSEGARAAFGPRDAKVKLVLFSDFQCPFCAKASRTVDVIRHNFGDKVQFVFRQFPLEFHEHAHLAAEASLAAAEQGKFWEFHDKVFAHPTAIARENLEAYAKEVGLDMARFKNALDKGTQKAAVDAEVALGRSANVEATPTLFLNGKPINDAADAPAVVAAIDTELRR